MWRQAQIPPRVGAVLIVMQVRMRTRGPSKVWTLAEEQSFTAGVGLIKTMEVVLSSPGQGRKSKVVVITDVVTGRQTIRMRVAGSRSEKARQGVRNVCDNSQGAIPLKKLNLKTLRTPKYEESTSWLFMSVTPCHQCAIIFLYMTCMKHI